MGVNEHYRLKKYKKFKQPVGVTQANLGRKRLKIHHGKSSIENISPNSMRQRQTVLSEYFTSPNTSSEKQVSDKDSLPKMINLPQLLKQLLRAQVIIRRIPESLIKPRSATTTSEVRGNLRQAIQRYCLKCKTLLLDRYEVCKSKHCKECGTLMVYVCIKCNVKHYVNYRHMKKHLKRCDGQTLESTENALSSVTLYYCNDCNFRTSNETSMVKHTKSVEHCEKTDADDTEADDEVREPILKYNQAQFIVKRTDIDYTTALKRYCQKCKKIATGSISKDTDTCSKCHTILQYRCTKCKGKCDSYKTMCYHLKAKCYPSIYRCPECNFIASCWPLMYLHLKKQQCSLSLDRIRL